METKKYLIVLILRILETDTDQKYPLSQVKIAELISKMYPCDRKTVGRNINFLKALGFPIVKTTKGYYMDKKAFSKEEINFVLNSVKRAESDTIDKDGLCDRLNECLTRYYKRF